MHTKMVKVLPQIEPTRKESSNAYVVGFAIVWFVVGFAFWFLFRAYNQNNGRGNIIERYNTGEMKQEYLKTGSECEWRPSLSTNWEVICFWE